MAQRVVVTLVDDLDGGPADETVTFGLDGTNYEIDLSSANAARLRDALANFVANGRRAGRSTAGRRRASPGDSALIREWAKSQGRAVNERGRISAELRAAYEAAH
jgi:hypothetical protein